VKNLDCGLFLFVGKGLIIYQPQEIGEL